MLTSAAVCVHLYTDGRDITIPCHRHCDAYEILNLLGYTQSDYRRDNEGFLTHDGRFLNRVEAAEYAVQCGQITVEAYDNLMGSCLYSEDLY